MVANPSGTETVGRSRPSSALGQVMRALREERGLGQEDLACPREAEESEREFAPVKNLRDACESVLGQID